MTIKELKIYYESEYGATKMFLANIPSWANKKEVINNLLQRLLGAAYLSQHCELSAQEVANLYNEYKYKIEKLGE